MVCSKNQALVEIQLSSRDFGAPTQATTPLQEQANTMSSGDTEGAEVVAQSSTMSRDNPQASPNVATRSTEDASANKRESRENAQTASDVTAPSIEDAPARGLESQENVQAAASVTTLFIEEAHANNMQSVVARSRLESLPTEVAWLVFEEFTDPNTVLDAAKSCRRLYSVSLERQKRTAAILFQDQGTGFVDLRYAATAVTMPFMDDLAAKDINNLVKAIKSVWSGEPEDSSINTGYHQILDFVRASIGLQPASHSAISWQTLRREPISKPQSSAAPTTPLAGAALLEPSSSAPNAQLTGSWFINPNMATCTTMQARLLASLGLCVRKLSTAYIEDYKRNSSVQATWPGDATRATIENSLWLFECFHRVIGGRWWRRWTGSKYMEEIEEAFRKGKSQKAERGVVSMLRDVNEFFHRTAVGPKLDAVVKAAKVTCGCPTLQELGKTVGPCAKCRRRRVDGVLSRGVSAILRVVETDDLGNLKDCFVWEGELPQEHHCFIGYFLRLPDE